MKTRTSEYKLLSGLFFRLLPYHVLLIVISAVNGIVDSLYASNMIGKSAMSAIGLFGPLNHFLYAAAMMLVSGTQILYGRYLARDREKIHQLFTVNLTMTGGLSVVISGGLILAASTGWTRVLTEVQPDLDMLNGYMTGQAIGIPALLIGQQLFSFLSLENQRKRTMAASLVCFAVNAAGNHLFIAVAGMGTFGLGLSSSISMWVFLAVEAMFYLRGKSEWKFRAKGCRWNDAPQIVRLGYSGALSRFVEMFRCLIVNYLMLKYVGSVGLSSFAATNSLLAVIWAVPFGMTAVARMLWSISVGEEDRQSLADVMTVVMTKGMLLMLAIVAGLILAAEPLTRLFYRDPADPVYAYTVMGFRLLPLCMPPAVLSLSYAAYCQVAEKKVMSVVLPVVDGVIGVSACSLILIPAMKMNGLYLANIFNGVICAAVILAGAWIVIRRRPGTMEELMAIPARIGVRPEERIDISVSRIEEVTEVSRKICAFCQGRGVSDRRSAFAGLCMEEMAGNVVTHGFREDGKRHTGDIRVALKGDEIVMRIRDNCRMFDPAEYMRIMQPGEDGTNVGIRLVYRIAKKVSYQNLLGLNVLTIRI